MNHECLAILFFAFKGDTDYLVNMLQKPDIKDFFHPGEIDLLRCIMAIAKIYHKLEEFVENVTIERIRTNEVVTGEAQSGTQVNIPVRKGLYIMSFCSGLHNVLKEYLEDIEKLEDRFLQNNQFSLSYARGAIEKYKTLFNMLHSVIGAIQMESVYGCVLIGRLHNYINCGIEPIERASRQIIVSVNKTFYNQLSNWMIFGNIKDIYEEFFISDCDCHDEEYLYDWELNKTKDPKDTADKHIKNVLKPSFKVQKFKICPNLLPSVMLIESAESILFIGRILWILQNDPYHKHINIDDRVRNIWSGKTLDYVSDIQSLENEPFDCSRFDEKIKEYRIILSKYLWQVMIDDADLLGHLQMIRDYYCLGRGELFQHFIVAAEGQLPEIPANYIIKNLNYIFVDIARQIYTNNDDSYKKFELVKPHYMDTKKYAENPLGNMEMYFEVEWPLHIIFRPKVISLFNKVFSFLIRVKKTHIDLHSLWLKHMDMKHVNHAVWSLRHNLMFLINNLQYYLQVDIIEAQFSILTQSIKNVNEYTDIVRMHSIFVCNLLSRTFVIAMNQADKEQNSFDLLQLPKLDFDVKPKVYNIIICLLELCDSFCLLATNWSSELMTPELRQLEDIQHNLDTILENLFRVLHSMQEKVSGPHLEQLLDRLDFNRWFTKSREQVSLNLSVNINT